MLTPQDIQEMDSITGLKTNVSPTGVPIQPSTPAVPSRGDELRSIAQKAQLGLDKAKPLGTLAGEKTTEAIQGGVGKIAGGVDIAQNATSKNPIVNAGKGLESGLRTAAGAVETATAPITGFLSAALEKLKPEGKSITGQEAENAGMSTDITDKLHAWTQAHPEAAQNLGDLFTVATAPLGLEGTLKTGAAEAISKQGLKEAGQGLKESVTGAVDAVKNIPEKLKLTPEQQLQNSIDAVNPDLKGKTKVQAYKDIVTGKRTAEPSSMFGKQSVSETPDITKLGTRLQDVITSHEPLKNLESLGKNLNTTEARIDQLLSGTEPGVIQVESYDAQKAGLIAKLENLKKEIPREFSSIRDNKSVFHSVIDYAKQLATEGGDDVKSLRSERTQFDRQTKLEYPNAYKDGYIDMKTPAGRAIKLARDTWNSHLYETAPRGSEIQKLIGREADILKAADYIAPKAAQLHGLNSLDKIKKYFGEHPIVAGLTALGALGAGAGIGVKAVQAASGQ